MINIKDFFNYIMFIGDPHLTSIQISKRNDDIHIMDTIINKLEQAALISQEKKCYTIITGDMFDSHKEHNIVLLTRVIKVLKKFYYKPITIIGNHEKTENVLNENNMLSALIEADLIDYFDNNKITVSLKINNLDDENQFQKIEIGGTNYGSKIPDSVERRKKDTDKIVWVTHHDLIFRINYPNAMPLKEINGVCLAVNGHIHSTQPQVQKKLTTWCCIGNITRQSIDMINHVPSIWLWNPFYHDNNYEKMIQIPLQYKKDIFRKPELINPDEDFTYNLSNNDDVKLNFIKLTELATKNNQDSNKTSDKDLVKSQMEKLGEIEKMPKELMDELFSILEVID